MVTRTLSREEKNFIIGLLRELLVDHKGAFHWHEPGEDRADCKMQDDVEGAINTLNATD